MSPTAIPTATQVEANNQLKGVTAEGANVLPARVIEDAFQNQYDKTLNYSDFKGAIQKLDSWYADRGIFGQVCCLSWLSCMPQAAVTAMLN